ncbi:hypothetical protein BC830DRAFT_1166399 [Chytriomyces sp. MP71]|nr:hypothetical protein BC830DRAFT_1166399 [Chytriomyces sp. MP71]
MFSRLAGRTALVTGLSTRTLRLELVSTKINVTSIDTGMFETELGVVRFYGNKNKADVMNKGISRKPHINIANVLMLPTN